MANTGRHGTVAPSRTIPTTFVRILVILIGCLPRFHASPLFQSTARLQASAEQPPTAQDATLWVYLAMAAALVLIGGAFAGLTIALMGQVSLKIDEELYRLLTWRQGRNLSASHQNLRGEL